MEEKLYSKFVIFYLDISWSRGIVRNSNSWVQNNEREAVEKFLISSSQNPQV